MLIPKTLYIKNFLSFEEEFYSFKNEQTVCVMGRNLTDDGQKSNGSGKSALHTALEITYTGNFSRKVTKSKIVRRGQKQAEISHVAWNNVKNEFLQIDRTIPIKGSEKVQIYLYQNTEEFEKDREKFLVEIATTADSNKWIESYIGINKEDLMNYFLPNELTYKSFFDSSDTAKKELIGRFSNSEIVDPAFERVDKDILKVDSDIILKEKELLKLESALEIKQFDLEKEQERDVKKENEEKIDELNADISDLKVSVNGILEEISNYTSENKKLFKTSKNTSKLIEEKVAEIDEYKSTSKDFEKEYERFEEKESLWKEKIKKANSILEEVDEDEKEINKDIKKVENQLAGEITCPKCKHRFILSNKFTVEELEESQKEYLKELEGCKEDRQKTNKLLEKYKQKKGEIDSEIEKIEDEESEYKQGLKKLNQSLESLNEDLEDCNSSIKTIERKIKNSNESINSKKESIKLKEDLIEEIKNSKIDKTKERELKKEIKQLKVGIKEKEGEIQELTNKVESIKEWKNNFTSFKSFLANKKLKIIEGMINKYLTDMHCDFQLKLEGYKTVNNGKDIREKITPYIFKDGELCDFGEFSKGERTRMNFANLLTLQTLVNETSKTGGLGLLFLDEILEGLDEEGLYLLLSSMEQIDKTVMLTTHVSNEKIHDNILMIEKTNGISKIVN